MELYFKENRDKDFFSVCETIRKETKEYLSVSDIAKRAVRCGAGSFYLSEKEYVRIYRRARMAPECKSELKNDMYAEIRERFLKAKRENPGINHLSAARIVAEQKAPRFYMTDGRASNLYYELLKNPPK